MDSDRIKAEIRRRMDTIGDGRAREKWDTGEWDSWATLSTLLEWIEAQQAADIKAAEGFPGQTLTRDELLARYGESDADPRTGISYGEIT